MDRFRKCVETVRNKWGEFVNRNWHNQPEGDKFRLLDVMLLIGAIRTWPLTKKWQIIGWRMYHLLVLFHYSIIVMNLIEHWTEESEFFEFIWHTSAFLSASTCFVQEAILRRVFASIQTAREYINGKHATSGDPTYDEAARKRFFQRIQLIVFAELFMIFVDELIVFIPGTGITLLFVTPRRIRSLGPTIGNVTQFLFTVCVWPPWVCKRLAGTTLICAVLHAFHVEFDIYVHGFDRIWNTVQLEVEANMPPTSSGAAEQDQAEAALVEQRNVQRDELFWKYLNQYVTSHIKKHQELLENLQVIDPVVRWFFFAVYYYTLILISPFIYVMMLVGFSMTTVMMTVLVSCVLLECYMWCSQIEAFQDYNATLELSILDLMGKIPYSNRHQNDYKKVHNALMIMKLNVRNSCQFSCGGVFDISVQVVTELLNISYTVFTFLRDMGNIIKAR